VTGLDAALRAAHRDGDGARLVGLCEQAARGPAEAFWLTQAWVYALEAADPRAEALRARLRALGAE
jgi:hypothetical protein